MVTLNLEFMPTQSVQYYVHVLILSKLMAPCKGCIVEQSIIHHIVNDESLPSLLKVMLHAQNESLSTI